MPFSLDTVLGKLETSRRELLDLGLRNPLLNFRTPRARGLTIVDELPTEVFRVLVLDGKAMTFLPAEAKTPEAEAPPELEVAALDQPAEAPAARHTDTKLHTDLAPAALQSALLNTYYAARTYIEEQGANVLYLALGMLEWYEADASQGVRRAPLLLIPVSLGRTSALERFHLRYTGEELGENLSLREKLKAEFGLTLPPLPELEDLDPLAYFDAIEAAVLGQPRWKVDRTAIALGFFSFAKFLMYKDLNAEAWPEGTNPAEHPLMRALLDTGFSQPAPTFDDDDFLDALPGTDTASAPAKVPNVVDADASQQLAILDVGEGRNLVIQGPPGTGKSQTITNMIADAIGRGKRVLFVAEKMAALEVVKRRLDNVGLGDACLELHSHKTNKRDVLQELGRCLNQGRPRLSEALESELAMLPEMRDRLNAYCDAVNRPVGTSGVTPYDAMGALLTLRQDEDLPTLDFTPMARWDAAAYHRHLTLVEEFERHLATMGPVAAHPFASSGKLHFSPTEEPALKAALEHALTATRALMDAAGALADELGLPRPLGRSECDHVLAAARRALSAPDLTGVWLRAEEWRGRREEVRLLLESGTQYAQLRATYEPQLIPMAWETDLTKLRQALAAHGRKWWRFLIGEYRQAKQDLAGMLTVPLPADPDAQLAIVDGVLAVRWHREHIRRHHNLGVALFGTQWQQEHSDFARLKLTFAWIQSLLDDLSSGKLPPRMLDALERQAQGGSAAQSVERLEAAARDFEAAMPEVAALLAIDHASGMPMLQQPFTAQDRTLREWRDRLGDLHAMARLNQLRASLREAGLDSVAALANWGQAGTRLVAAFKQAWYAGLLELAYRDRPALVQFNGPSHELVIAKFRELDALAVAYNRARLAHVHWQHLPRGEAGGQLGVLAMEINKKARHLPIRQLMTRAGNAVQAIKPVFMMSPLSVATYLPPGCLEFDLVVFDEASQVRPVDAFGAILRGKQVVVVGDDRQMPPTDFFATQVLGDGDGESVTEDLESILGLFAARMQKSDQRMLRWHYRSRHESLITVSNREFYENRLVIFPSPDAGREELGLRYHHLPTARYDRGGSATNLEEAKVVAEAVMAHARRRPDLTLGVAAFSQAQMRAVQDQLEILRRQDPACEPYFAAHPHEPFFVKNLETVQGDERDVIFISIGYGRTEAGVLSMNFGPLNLDGGERRLNVLITRARLRCEVFTNFKADDLDLSRTPARGVKALKLFLQYAETGRLEMAGPTGREPDSPFEEVVRRALEAQGHQVQPQVGAAGFFIDLAVVDPERPGRYLLGIECDGASYHSARSARDRDRLRQQVLEGLGWRIHRVWSTDWFRQPEREIARMAAAIEDARRASAQRPAPEAPPPGRDSGTGGGPVLERDAEAPAPAPEGSAIPYRLAALEIRPGNQELPAASVHTRSGWVTQVAQVEGPVHVAEVGRRILAAAGVKRAGVRIQRALDEAIEAAVEAGLVVRQGDFLQAPGQAVVVRDRAAIPAAARKLVWVSPAELRLAIVRAVSASYGIEPAQVPPAACKLLGFGRVNDDMRTQVDQLVQALIADHTLELRGQHLVPAGT